MYLNEHLKKSKWKLASSKKTDINPTIQNQVSDLFKQLGGNKKQISLTELLDGKNKIDIPIEKCFVIEFPKSLGGKEKYLQFLKDYRELAKLSPMMNFFNNLLQGQANYDIKEHQRIHDIEVWKKTKLFSWHHRSSGDEKISGYYHIYRHLLFWKNKIKLRGYIVEELSKIISTISEMALGQKAELKIEGLLTIDKVEEKLEQWKTGQLDPKTINDIL